jgi:hypothetical protein
MRKRPRLQLVQPNPQFNLNKFKTAASAQTTPTHQRRRRPQIMEPFVPITYTWARKLRNYRVNSTAWFLLVALDEIIYQPGGRNPTKLTTEVLASIGLGYWTAYRALGQLEKAGAIKVERRPGRCPVVSPLWRS